MQLRARALGFVLVCGAALALASGSCGGGGGTPASPVAPGPAATPTPGPTPEPPLSASCASLPYGSAQYTCRDEASDYLHPVLDAIDTLKQEHPEYFNGNMLLNVAGYYAGLIRILDRQGLCAAFDGAELAVKKTNEYSEQFRVQTSWREVRKVSAYIGTCYPAVFPLAPGPRPTPPPGCRLPASSEAACDKIDSRHAGDVEAAIDEVMKQRPELFDFERGAAGGDRPLIKDLPAYYSAVLAALATRGYCGIFDGEEIQLKRTNEFSEHFDINYADVYVRRGPGTYRSSCYPAAF